MSENPIVSEGTNLFIKAFLSCCFQHMWPQYTTPQHHSSNLLMTALYHIFSSQKYFLFVYYKEIVVSILNWKNTNSLLSKLECSTV
jgi:hypothetical protein